MKSKKEPVMVQIDGTWFPVIKITPHGLIFKNGHFPMGDWCFADILLPFRKEHITAVIEIVGIDTTKNTKARFKNIQTLRKNGILRRITAMDTTRPVS